MWVCASIPPGITYRPVASIRWSASTSTAPGRCPAADGAEPEWSTGRPGARIAAINRVGVEEYGDNDFYGTSYFVDPRGQFVGEVASGTDEELVVRDLDLDVIDEVRQQWAFYRDRRPDAYESLTRP